MDKKSILFGIAFIIGGFILMFQNASKEAEQRQRALAEEARQAEQAFIEESIDPTTTKKNNPEWVAAESNKAIPSSVQALDPVELDPTSEEKTFTIENDVFRITFTSRGGAIKSIRLKDYPRDNPHTTENPRPVILNAVSDSPALALKRDLGDRFASLVRDYQLVSQDDNAITFAADLSNGIEVRRTYRVVQEGERHQVYSIQHETAFVNRSESTYNLQPVFLNLGTAAPTDADFSGFNLNAGFLNEGDFDTIQASKLAGGGIIFKSGPRSRITETGSIEWGSVKNQFFTTIYTPETPASSLVAQSVKFPIHPVSQKETNGITAELQFSIPTLAPGETYRLAGSFYAGPTNFEALSKLGKAQEDVMQLGWFIGLFLGVVAFVAKILLTLMGAIHNWFGNWGVAIILTTLAIRIVLYPLTAKAARAAKRMQKLAKPMQDLREKYKDNQKKANEEIMLFMRKHKVNPLSGCWPVLIQFPIFIAFFNLLRNSSDLRFAEFLWITDLSMPDATISFGTNLPILGASLNVLPFFWLVSMHFQMRMMPSPAVDNPQMKIMKFMPYIFFPFTYFFSSGLVLYWTTTNLFSIFQQYLTNRIKDEEDFAIESELEAKEKKATAQGPLISKKKKKANKKRM